MRAAELLELSYKVLLMKMKECGVEWEGRGQRAEGRGQRAEGRGQRAEGRLD